MKPPCCIDVLEKVRECLGSVEQLGSRSSILSECSYQAQVRKSIHRAMKEEVGNSLILLMTLRALWAVSLFEPVQVLVEGDVPTLQLEK